MQDRDCKLPLQDARKIHKAESRILSALQSPGLPCSAMLASPMRHKVLQGVLESADHWHAGSLTYSLGRLGYAYIWEICHIYYVTSAESR